MTETAEGDLVGTTLIGGTSGEGTIFKIKKDGSGFTILRNLSASGGDGRSAYASLTRGSDGQFYGTTRLGSDQGAGTVFAIDALGRGYRILAGPAATNVANPTAAVIEGDNGMLYGNSLSGGTNNSRGALFQLSRDGQGLTRLHDFGATGDGYFVNAALTKATNGYFYGVTTLGSALFRVLPDGSDYSVLKLLSSGALNPTQPLLQGSDGNLYGTTYFSYLAGTTNATNGCIFRIDQDGGNYTVLKFFSDRLTTGANPKSPLLEGSDGMLYGTTYSGGTTNEAGSVFRINKDGSGFEQLHAFVGVQGDARHPCGRIVEAADGFLYGSSERGGVNDQGALFKLDKNGGGYAVLASFDSSTGAIPRGGVALGPNEALYGTTDQGGDSGAGTIFRFGTTLEYISQVAISNNQVYLTCVGASGTNYVIERNSDLEIPWSWSPVQTTNAPSAGQFQIVDQPPVGARVFYRMKR
ncbi:MAG: choice-of-anchor tandem repeat GloVer-containing protein [Verrucomicrobiota bacterium]